MNALSAKIFSFLEKYAKTAADFDPAYDDASERFNGPDSSMLYSAAIMIENDTELSRLFVHSDWHSGCYKTNLDSDGEQIHSSILDAISKLKKSK